LRFPLRLLRIDQVVRGWLQGKETIDIYVMVYWHGLYSCGCYSGWQMWQWWPSASKSQRWYYKLFLCGQKIWSLSILKSAQCTWPSGRLRTVSGRVCASTLLCSSLATYVLCRGQQHRMQWKWHC